MILIWYHNFLFLLYKFGQTWYFDSFKKVGMTYDLGGKEYNTDGTRFLVFIIIRLLPHSSLASSWPGGRRARPRAQCVIVAEPEHTTWPDKPPPARFLVSTSAKRMRGEGNFVLVDAIPSLESGLVLICKVRLVQGATLTRGLPDLPPYRT